MQYTRPVLTTQQPHAQIELALSDLEQAFAAIPDPRRAQGRVYRLPNLLCLMLAGLLCNCLSVLAIAEWAARQDPATRTALGLPPERSPSQSTLHRLLRRLDPAHLSRALTAYFEHSPPNQRRARASQAIAVDGKTHRGQLQFEPQTACSIHDIEAFCHDLGIVLAQLALDNQGGEAELAAAPRLLESISWQGRVLTGDALYCQTSVCDHVLADEGDYVLVVKGNQPELRADVELLFAAPEMQSAAAARLGEYDYRAVRTLDKGHGRVEERRATASSELAGYSRWPGLAQVVRITRTWQQKGVTRQATHYLVTSLPPEEASVAQLLAFSRGHWQIENGLHYVKDVTLGEDKSLIHVGAGGAVMAALRSAAVSVLHRAGIKRIAATLRAHSQDPTPALRLLGLLNSSDA